jgi:hypothetical protein
MPTKPAARKKPKSSPVGRRILAGLKEIAAYKRGEIALFVRKPGEPKARLRKVNEA